MVGFAGRVTHRPLPLPSSGLCGVVEISGRVGIVRGCALFEADRILLGRFLAGIGWFGGSVRVVVLVLAQQLQG